MLQELPLALSSSCQATRSSPEVDYRTMGLRSLLGVVVIIVAACSAPARPSPAGEAAGPEAADAALADGGSLQGHAPGTWCADRTASLCEDFDMPALTSSRWSVNLTAGGGGTGLPPGALDLANYASAPNAFTARTAAIAGASTETVQIQGSAGAPDASHVDAEFAFAVRVAALGASSPTEVARIEGVNPITFASYAVALAVSASGSSLELTQGAQAKLSKPLAAAPRVGAWSRVVLRLGLERTVYGPPVLVAIQIDDAPAETFSIERGMGVRPFLRLGLVVTGPSAPCEVGYDDVTYLAR